MPKFRGSCHCARVSFEVDATPSELVDCNCSLCQRKGALYVELGETHSFRLLSGEGDLSTYRFNTNTATHYFCRHCGVHPFHHSRFDPENWSINARCLEGFDLSSLPRTTFDGKNWEQAARAEGWRE